MALNHKVLTLSGAAQDLLDAFGLNSPIGGADDVACSFISLQPGSANANPVEVGGPAVSLTDYGARLPAANAGIPPSPYVIEPGGSAGVVRLSSVWVIGTVGEKLHILYQWA